MRSLLPVYLLALLCALYLPLSAEAAFDMLTPVETPLPEIVRVMVVTSDKRQMQCSGVAVSPYHILTAAHCLNDMTSATVLFADGQRDSVLSTFVHPDWNAENPVYSYDVAVLRVTEPIASFRSARVWSEDDTDIPAWSVGYPLLSQQQYFWRGTIDAVENGIVYQRGVGRDGMSGSPLVQQDVVVGVHSHLLGDRTGYAPVTEAIIEYLQSDRERLPAPAPSPTYQLYLPIVDR